MAGDCPELYPRLRKDEEELKFAHDVRQCLTDALEQTQMSEDPNENWNYVELPELRSYEELQQYMRKFQPMQLNREGLAAEILLKMVENGSERLSNHPRTVADHIVRLVDELIARLEVK